jgi:hypothetical protein
MSVAILLVGGMGKYAGILVDVLDYRAVIVLLAKVITMDAADALVGSQLDR